MSKITTKEELKALKTEVEPTFSVRNKTDFSKDANEIHVRICMGSSCLGSGAGKVMDTFKELIKMKGLEDGIKVVKEVQTGCHGLCEMGPIVIVNPGDVLIQGYRLKT
jgi:NADH:ubiquinone oxidoreductase subunit E